VISLRTNVQAGKRVDGDAQVSEDRSPLTPIDQSDVLRDITPQKQAMEIWNLKC
jgi:hypothetical protein